MGVSGEQPLDPFHNVGGCLVLLVCQIIHPLREVFGVSKRLDVVADLACEEAYLLVWPKFRWRTFGSVEIGRQESIPIAPNDIVAADSKQRETAGRGVDEHPLTIADFHFFD